MNETAAKAALEPGLLAALAQTLGQEHVILDEAERAFYSTDVYRRGETALAVIRPGSVAELAEAVRICHQADLNLAARGGGMSYTDGYLHATESGVTFDISRLDRIVRVDTEDMYVTVECGCTWAQLHEALASTGLRTPYWGPLSGLVATVGGALSQNSVFFGGNQHGSAAETVIGLDVVLADGSLLPTGAHTHRHGAPFMRQDGPDFTHVFTADTGAFGIKAVATLRLIAAPAAQRYASFAFETDTAMCAVMSEIARQGLASECFGFDPFLQNARVLGSEGDTAGDLKTLAKVARKSGLSEAAKVALAGRGYVNRMKYGVHVIVEDICKAGVEHRLQRIRELAAARDGREVANSLPKIVAANPFAPPNSMLGPKGERWVPIHGIVPHSRGPAIIEAVERIWADKRELMERHAINCGYLTCTVGAAGFLFEPVFFWPDAQNELHRRALEPRVLASLPTYPPAPEARAAVEEIRQAIGRAFLAEGAVHFQIGKTYPYREGRTPAAWALLERFKQLVDPDARMNPGQLGL